MAQPHDYYEVLGVARDADAKAIKDAFRELTLRYHPDRNRAPDAAEKFREIVEAYSVLSDPQKRKAFDVRGTADVSGVSMEDLLRGMDFGDLFGGLGRGENGFFDAFFGARRTAGPSRGEDLETRVAVSLERIFLGGEEKVQVTRPRACESCHGTGSKAGTTPKPCETCGGTGQHVVTRQEKNVVLRQISTCATCRGRKSIIEQPCAACSGRGTAEVAEVLTVKIPPGVEDGMILRIAGHGLPSPDTNGVPGDLLIVVHTLPDARFERRGADLVRVETLSVPDAVLGTTRDVPTLDGPVKVKVRRGTQPGTVLCLEGKGLPRVGGPSRGDLFVELHVQVPERLTREEAELYGRLRACSTRPSEAQRSN